jgi:Protein of unknown function (DUF742)
MSPAERVSPVVGHTGARFGSARRRRAAETQADAVESWAADAEEGQAPEIPQSRRLDAAETLSAGPDGAGAPAPGRATDAEETRAADAEEAQAADAAAEIPQARQPGAAETLSAGLETQAADPGPERADDDGQAQDEPLSSPGAEDDGLGGVKVRPYVRTGGRTRPAVDLAIEALVSTAPGAPEPPGADHRAIAALCASPRSVAEIAALLEIPLGVARVLVGDLAQDGGVVVHGTSGPDGPDPTLMQRVLDGLRRL